MLKITIEGPLAAGKTVLLNEIALHLMSKGLNVTCFDEDAKRPIAPRQPWLPDGVWHPRDVRIETKIR